MFIGSRNNSVHFRKFLETSEYEHRRGEGVKLARFELNIATIPVLTILRALKRMQHSLTLRITEVEKAITAQACHSNPGQYHNLVPGLHLPKTFPVVHRKL